jgi:hypothetical protein
VHLMQRNKRPVKQAIASSVSLLAPVRGWNARDPEASMAQGYAIYLDNWWPTPTEVQLRKGAEDHATGYTGPTRHLMAYQGVTMSRMFASTDTSIYDVTAAGAVGAAVASVTSGKFVHTNFRTSGTSYLFAVNGVDNLLRYDGAAWLSVASYAINGGGTLLTPNIVHLNVFKRRLFFIEKDSLDFFYFAVDSAAGNVTRFPLGGIFGKGGKLVAMATWTIDGGAGVDDFAVFITSEGQLAVYQGTDPDVATAWALRGVYDLSKPIGKKCFLKFGGDMLYISEDGVFPLSKALQSVTVNASAAVTDLISNAFSIAAKNYGVNYGWQGIYSFTDSILLFNIPTTEASISLQYAMNTKNGAWARLTDWNAFCWEILDNQLYMGMSNKVAKAWYGLNDFGGNINCYAKGAFSYLGSRGRMKQITQLRPMLRISGDVAVDVAVDMDFSSGLAFGPAVFSGGGGSLWGSALWGVGLWSGFASVKLDWLTVAVKEGFAAAPRLRVAANDATVAWFATDMAFELGAVQG